MPDTDASLDRRPAIAVCAWDGTDKDWDLVEDLSGEPWNPPGARSLPVPAPAPADDPDALAAILSAHLRSGDCRALLLVGRTRHGPGFRLQLRAENRRAHSTDRLDHTGPGVARATAPAGEILRALAEAGLPAAAASNVEDDEGSDILYRILADLPDGGDSPSIGLLRAPVDAPDDQVRLAMKAALATMARHLAPLPRARSA